MDIVTEGSPRPTIVAVLGCVDHGPCDDGATANCPHCGAEGRYVYTALMSDGSRKGMMSGCLKTFRQEECARECLNALGKQARKQASRWDLRVLDALSDLTHGNGTIESLRNVCRQVRIEKRLWLARKGWGRR